MGRHPVLCFHGLGSHTAQIAGTCARVEDRHVLRHRLERVAVTRHNKDGRALVTSAVGQGRQDVVSLKPFARERHNTHRVQDFTDQLHLPLKLFGSRIARPLIVRVLLGPK